MSSTPNKFKKVVFFGIFLAFLLIIIGLVKSLVGFLGVEDRFLRVERDIEVLEREKTDIESKLILEEDDFVAEQQLRNSLGLSRSGEAVVVLPAALIEETTQERRQEEIQIQELENWQKWWNLFF